MNFTVSVFFGRGEGHCKSLPLEASYVVVRHLEGFSKVVKLFDIYV